MTETRLVPLVLGALSVAGCTTPDGETLPTDSGRNTATMPEGGLRLVDARVSDGRSLHDGAPADGYVPSRADSGVGDAWTPDPGPALLRVPDWSVRKRVRATARDGVLLEEVLVGLNDSAPGATRLRRLAEGGAVERVWSTSAGGYIADFCSHPSGALSAVVVGTDRTVSLVRLSPDLKPLATASIHDPAVAGDPHVPTDAGAIDLFVNGFTLDAARIASVGESFASRSFRGRVTTRFDRSSPIRRTFGSAVMRTVRSCTRETRIQV